MAATLQSSAHFEKTSFNGNAVRTHSFTVPSGSNQLLVVKWLTDKFEAYSGAAYAFNGDALTVAGTSARGTVNFAQIAWLKAPDQGTFNLTLTTSDQHNLGTLVIELWQDVDQSDTPVWATSESSTATSWTSGATVAAGYVCTSAITGNFSTTTTNGGTTDILANQATYSGKNASVGSKEAGQPGWTWTGTAQVAGGSLVIKSAAGGGGINADASLTLDGIALDAAATVVPGVTAQADLVLGSIALDAAATVSGGTLTIGPFRNKSGSLLTALTVAHVVVLRASDRAPTLSLADQVTNGSGYLSITHASLVAGTAYMVPSWNADGTAAGNGQYTAA